MFAYPLEMPLPSKLTSKALGPSRLSKLPPADHALVRFRLAGDIPLPALTLRRLFDPKYTLAAWLLSQAAPPARAKSATSLPLHYVPLDETLCREIGLPNAYVDLAAVAWWAPLGVLARHPVHDDVAWPIGGFGRIGNTVVASYLAALCISTGGPSLPSDHPFWWLRDRSYRKAAPYLPGDTMDGLLCRFDEAELLSCTDAFHSRLHASLRRLADPRHAVWSTDRGRDLQVQVCRWLKGLGDASLTTLWGTPSWLREGGPAPANVLVYAPLLLAQLLAFPRTRCLRAGDPTLLALPPAPKQTKRSLPALGRYPTPGSNLPFLSATIGTVGRLATPYQIEYNRWAPLTNNAWVRTCTWIGSPDAARSTYETISSRKVIPMPVASAGLYLWGMAGAAPADHERDQTITLSGQADLGATAYLDGLARRHPDALRRLAEAPRWPEPPQDIVTTVRYEWLGFPAPSPPGPCPIHAPGETISHSKPTISLDDPDIFDTDATNGPDDDQEAIIASLRALVEGVR